MQEQDPNYGTHQENPRLTRVPVGGAMSAQDEQTWSMLAHLSVLLNIITGIGGPIAALIIWLVYRDKSQRVAFHALQSLWYQVAWAVILAVGWFITVVLMFVLIGFLLVPVMAIASLVPFVHQCYAAYKVYQGTDYRYPVIADLIDGGRTVT
ncbi:MAG TPA: DUF4870 domain-containing protein [Rubrobacteraceae bacterium]|nr:DUF4870 domain-containing protein [Rubrobacteraceae bacterium]